MAMTATEVSKQQFLEPSLLKHQLYSQYARGEIDKFQLADEIAKIRPPKQALPPLYGLALLVVTLAVACLVPYYLRRDD